MATLASADARRRCPRGPTSCAGAICAASRRSSCCTATSTTSSCYDGKLYTLSEFLGAGAARSQQGHDRALQRVDGRALRQAQAQARGPRGAVLTKEPAKVLPLLERALTTEDKLAVILEYADTIAPAGDTSFSTMDDRAAAVTLHRWSLLRALEQRDSIVLLVAREPVELHPRSCPTRAWRRCACRCRRARSAPRLIALPRSRARPTATSSGSPRSPPA